MRQRLNRLADVFERVGERVGTAVAWLAVLLVLSTFLVVVLRYALSIGLIWLQELSVYLHALVFLLGAAYTLGRDEHVRVDIFYRKLSPRGRGLVDTLGVLLLLLPSVGVIFWMSYGYVLRSWAERESSGETGGLPYPFPPLLKTALLLACVLLALQGLAWVLRHLTAGRAAEDGQ